MWRGKDSLPVGEATCLPCRRSRSWPPSHGASGYRRGCRCDVCREGVRAKQAKYVEKYRAEHGVNPSTFYKKRGGYADSHRNDWWIDPKRRYAIYDRDEWTCGLCGGEVDREWTRKSPTAATLDHIVPRSLGGTHDDDNLTTAHAYCNAIRQDQDFTEFVIWAALEKITLQATQRKLAATSR